MLYDVNGAPLSTRQVRPERSAYAEEKLREQLKQIDSLLDVKWYDSIGRYALVAKWPVDDKRWQLYQSGEMDDFHDILGWFAEDMFDANSNPVPLDNIENKVLALLNKADNQRVPWKQRLAQIAEKNVKRRRDLQAGVLNQAECVATDLYNIAGRVEDVVLRRIMKQVAEETSINE